MIDEQEMYRRLDEIVPGTNVSESDSQLQGLEIYFERLSMSGLAEMHRYSVDSRLYEFFEIQPFDTLEKTQAYLEKLLQRMAAGEGLKRNAMYWFVRRKSDDHLVGTATLVELNYPRKSIEWGYGVDPELWGRGYILQIQECLKHYTFEVLELNRLHGITMVENERTISSVLAAGMKHEGTLRQYYCKNGHYHDAWLYGMISDDYFSKSRSSISRRYCVDDVIKVVSSVLTQETITEDTKMSNCLSWDSLNHMSIMVAVSQQMGITLSPHDVAFATSVAAITSIITKAA